MRIPTPPTIFGLRAGMLLHLYRRRLRAQPIAEALAGFGVAVGVALVFGVLLTNASLTSSAAKLIHGLDGNARLTLVARSPQGLGQAVAARVGRMRGVEVAAPVLRRNVTVTGPRGSEAVQLIGVSPSAEDLGGLAAQELAAGAKLLKGGIGLPSGVARSIGAGRNSTVRVASAGRVHDARVRVVLTGALAGVSASPAAVAVLHTAQRLANASHALSEVLVQPQPGRLAQVRAELGRIAGAGAQVRPADAELRLLGVATEPNRQSTSLFTAIAVMIGFLLALNAMLLTVPERRRFIAELRVQGYDRAQIATLLGFQALMLGLCASLAGIGLGYLLSHLFFQRVPDFLAAAFPIGAEEVLRPVTVAAAIACGVAATAIASLAPLLDLDLGLRALAGGSGHHLRATRLRLMRGMRFGSFKGGLLPQIGEGAAETVARSSILALALVGLALAAVAVVVSLASAKLTIASGVLLALAAVCVAPLVLAGAVRALPAIFASARSPSLFVASSEMSAITARAVALTGIVALAVYGGIAIGGAREDLLRGISQATAQYFGSAQVWVTSGRDVFNTNGFPAAGPAAAVAAAPGVSSVRVYRGGLLDVGSRRMWVRARPAADSHLLEASQIVEGSQSLAERRIRAGGWAAVSSVFAQEEHLRTGSRFMLPTPSGPVGLRVAAVMTNSGWPPGTITIDSADYARWWHTGQAAALEVSLRRGLAPAQGARRVQAALAGWPGLRALTAAQRAAESEASARQGLRTLQEISMLLLIAAALAVASALSATIWQRRRRLAALKVQGYDRRQLWGAMLIESTVTILAGSLLGALVGVGGHALASRFLAASTGFPAPFGFGALQLLVTVALFCATALAVIALPGIAAANVSPRTVLQE